METNNHATSETHYKTEILCLFATNEEKQLNLKKNRKQNKWA